MDQNNTCLECGKSFNKKRKTHLYCCEFCRNTAYVKNHPEIVKKVKQKWTDSNKVYRTILARKSRENNPELYILRAAQNRAQKQNLNFNLDITDINIPEYCPILNIKLKLNSGKPGGSFDSPSLDKINPSLGYIKGNVQIISHQANMMKSNATKEQLILFSKWIQKSYE